MRIGFEKIKIGDIERAECVELPKKMLTDTAFASLSLGAKVVYAILLKQTGLYGLYGWHSNDERLNIIYPISAIQMLLDVDRNTATDVLLEVEKFGLINVEGSTTLRICVKDFMPKASGLNKWGE